MKITNLSIAMLLLLLYSCEKNNDRPSNPGQDPTISINAFFPMNIGNYWVYEFVTKDPNGEIIGNTSYDTLKIVSDTIINNNRYYWFTTNKPSYGTQFLRRDSLGYIIDIHGDIKLYPSAIDGIIGLQFSLLNGDTMFSVWEEYENGISINTPIGNFETLGRLVNHQTWPNYGGNSAVDSNLYSNIGHIQRSYSYLSGAKNTGIIIDYHLVE